MIVAAPSLSLGRIPGRGAAPIPFSPTDLPELELWLDANEGVVNTAGNNFTDATRTITIQGFPGQCGFTVILGVSGTVNGRNRYYDSNPCEFGGQIFLSWTGTNWNLRLEEYPQEGDPYVTEYNATGDTEYPWQATWADGTVSPTATTFDIPATNDQSVARWRNKVSGKPNLNQPTLASRPVFKSDVNGRKAVYFNGDALSSSGFSTFSNEYSYYIVSDTFDGGASGTDLRTAIRLGTSTFTIRGRFGATSSTIAVSNQTIQNSSISKASSTGAVWSARFNTSSNQVTVGKNLTSELVTNIGNFSANQSTITIGANNTSGSNAPVISNFSEVLAYRATHDETTANQIINYLVQKWNINTAL